MDFVKSDSILADSLISGDIIRFTQSYREIHSVEDLLTHILVITDNGEELLYQPDALVDIYLEG